MYGDKKSVLYAEEVAEVLDKPSAEAILALIRRGGLPLPVLEVGGRPCVSINSMAEFLAGKCVKPIEAKNPSGAPPAPAPKRKHESVGALIKAFRTQQAFIDDVCSKLQAIELRHVIEDNGIDGSDGAL